MNDKSPRTVLAGRIKASWEEINDVTTQAVLDEVPHVRVLDPDAVTSGVQLIVAVYSLFATSQSDQASIHISNIERTATAWALQGVTLEQQTAAAAASARATFKEFSAHAATITVDSAPLLQDVGDALLLAQGTVQAALAKGCAVAAEADAAAGDTRPLVDRLLDPPDETRPAGSEATGAGLGEQLGVITLVSARGLPETLYQAARGLARSRPDVHQSAVRYDPVPHVVLVVEVSPTSEWAEAVAALEDEIAALNARFVASPHEVVRQGVRAAYEGCRSYIEYAPVVLSRSARLDPALLQMHRAVALVPEVERGRLVRLALGRLITEAPGLVHKLDALVALGSYQALEDLLNRSERSLSRDVGNIKELTGHDWNEVEGRLVLSFATYCRWLAAALGGEYHEATWGPKPNFTLLEEALR